MFKCRNAWKWITGFVGIFQFVPMATIWAVEPSDFDKIVQPFLKQNCLDCHAGDHPEGKLDLSAIGREFERDEAANLWLQVLKALQFGDMPPPDQDRPDPIAKANVIRWIEQQMDQSGRIQAYRKKLLNPAYGNYVSHELLFSGQIKTLPFSPSRIWRLSPELFKGKGIRGAQSPFSHITSENGIRDYSATSGVDQSTVEMILINTEQFLNLRAQDEVFRIFADDQPVPTNDQLVETVRQEFRRAIGREPNDVEQSKYVTFLKKNIADGGNSEGLKTTIKAMFLSVESIYRMELGLGPKDEHGRRRLSTEELAYAISYALTDHGPERIPNLRKAVQQKKLSTKADVARVVKEILDDSLRGLDSKATPRIQRFFEEFFGYDKMARVFKDKSRIDNENIKQWNHIHLTLEANQFIHYFLNRDQDVIKELLTSNLYFIAHPGDNEVARELYEEVRRPDYVELKVNRRLEEFRNAKRDPSGKRELQELERIRRDAENRVNLVRLADEDNIIPFPGITGRRGIRQLTDLIYIEPYNLPATRRTQRQEWSWVIEQPIEMPKEQRAGLLTHPTWLAAHSLNDGNDPIRRGIWIQEKLLAGVIQDVPPDVDANVPNDPHKTLRERMAPLRAERCWRCHRKMNPLGEPFEIFDDWGRYRTHVYFDETGQIVTKRGKEFEKRLAEGKFTARKVDATGEIRGSGDSNVDGKVNDAIEMIHRLGPSDRARQSVIRHLFRYFMGRNEMLSDSRTLIEAERAYLKNGGSFKALVVSLLSSDSFLYRR